jgi:hypothetical protein
LSRAITGHRATLNDYAIRVAGAAAGAFVHVLTGQRHRALAQWFKIRREVLDARNFEKRLFI